MAVCPDNRISGGKVLKAKTRPVPNRLARALRLAVFGLHRAENKMGQLCRRLKGRLGKAEGMTAGAHQLARILYAMILHQTPYDEDTAFQTTAASTARHRKHLGKQAACSDCNLLQSLNLPNVLLRRLIDPAATARMRRLPPYLPRAPAREKPARRKAP